MPAPSWPVLNWKEIAKLIESIAPRASEMHVERVIVPERSRFPEGYLKGEWAIRLSGRRREAVLNFSVRPRHPYIEWIEARGPKAAPAGTRSVFDLSLSKNLAGSRLLSIEALPRERIVRLRFSADHQTEWGLYLVLIPALPEALLVRLPEHRIVARSRARAEGQSEPGGVFIPPDGSRAPPELTLREQLVASPEAWLQAVESALDQEAFETRLSSAARKLREDLEHARDRIRQNEAAAREAEREPDWQRFGELLKSTLPDAPPLVGGARAVPDYETGRSVEVPCDPKLGPKAQVEKFFRNARRKAERARQARARMQLFSESAARFDEALRGLPAFPDWVALEGLERALGAPATTAGAGGRKAAPRSWPGRGFVSRDGLAIWVGRTKEENLDLTFKHARGNDLWMHVRGRPGAHTVIPIAHGKSAPLETLLDAAALTLFYSGGEKWGKTEVDYTFKKHVKRIRDSSEASYTHNKTLIVEADPERLKRLIGQSA